jgi:hypothetical protein
MRDFWAPTGEGAEFKPTLPGTSPKAFWSKLGVPDIRAYMEGEYEGQFTDVQMAEATAEAINQWYDEPGLFKRVGPSIRPTQNDVLFDDVLRELGRTKKRKMKFLELFDDEVSAGRKPVEAEANDEEAEG